MVEAVRIFSRGLKLKVGIATGAVMDSINTATGHIGYRGKVMNRASRIASNAGGSQVRLAESLRLPSASWCDRCSCCCWRCYCCCC
jgi:class 3 adenylate cyclase